MSLFFSNSGLRSSWGLKSSCDWTANDLDVYRINLVSQNKEEFFGTNDLPDPAEPSESLAGFMAAETREDAADKKTSQLLHYLDQAMDPKSGQEASSANFAAELLKALDYDDENRLVFIRRTIPFFNHGMNSVAQPDVCIVDDGQIQLLLQEDTSLMNMKDPEPQVIVGAIAAFALNNRTRERELNLPLYNSMTIPCLTMAGTSPIFYKVTVTAALSKAIQDGSHYGYSNPTRVFRYIPTLPCKNGKGMRSLPNRLEILRCLEAFKKFVGGVFCFKSASTCANFLVLFTGRDEQAITQCVPVYGRKQIM